MYKRTLRILSCGGGGRFPGRAMLNSVERVLLAAAVSSCRHVARAAAASCSRERSRHLLRASVGRRKPRAVLPQRHGWRGGLGLLLLLRVLRPLLGVLFAAAVSRRLATTNLFEQTTESMLFDLLSVFGSRVAGGMRHCWLRSCASTRTRC